MKATILIMLLMLLSLSAFPQNWELFVKNQKSVYKHQFSQGFVIEAIIHDSSRTAGNSNVLYFNANTEKQPCYRALKESVRDMWFNPYNRIDSLVKINDSVIFFRITTQQTEPFIFKPFVHLNDKWVTNGDTLQCTQMGTMSVFGTMDSVKTFSCSGTYNALFVLSKSHGLIRFIHFGDFIDFGCSPGSFYELIGYEDDQTSGGYTLPDFSDYFHLSAGDILYWRDNHAPANPLISASVTWHVDSIMAASIFPDSVYYEFKRNDFDENGLVSHTGNYTKYHLRREDGFIVQHAAEEFGLTGKNSTVREMFYIKSAYYTIEDHDTITYLDYVLPGITVDTSNCQIGFMADYDKEIGFSTREGFNFEATYSWGEQSSAIIGSVINGKAYGDTQIPTALSPVQSQGIRIYPNPFTDYIVIESDQHSFEQVEIFDAAGNLVKSERYLDHRMNLGHLKPGMYVLKLRTDKGMYVSVLVKTADSL